MDLETKRQSTQALLESAELLFTEAECRAALQKVADAISHDLSDKYPLLLPVMGGAVVFTGQLLPLLRFPLDFDYVHVSRYGDKLQGGNFNWLRMPNPEQIAGRHVVILDDILDEGHTLLAVKRWCEDQGAADVRVAVLAVVSGGTRSTWMTTARTRRSERSSLGRQKALRRTPTRSAR